MNKHIAVSVLGKDKPGIVAAISKVLFEAGCNIEDSSMTLLRSEFAMILLVSVPNKATVKKLEKELKKTGNKSGLSILLRSISDAEIKKEKSKGTPFVISVYGADKTGIVYTISSLLSKNKINITDVQTKIVNKDNNPTYVMFLEVDLPQSIKSEEIKEKLEKTASSLRVTINIKPLDIPQL